MLRAALFNLFMAPFLETYGAQEGAGASSHKREPQGQALQGSQDRHGRAAVCRAAGSGRKENAAEGQMSIGLRNKKKPEGRGLKEGNKEKESRAVFLGAGLIVLTAALNIAAWNSTAFCDWYIANVFPIWVSTYGRLTGFFSFSVGEWLIGAGVALAALALLLGLFLVCAGLVRGAGRLLRKAAECVGGKERGACRKAGKACRIYDGFIRFTKGFYLFFGWTFLAVCLIMTLNCFILYHASTFSQHYFGEDEGEYTLEELIAVYNMVATRCNELADSMERDETGMVLYKGGLEKKAALEDMADEARGLMAALGKEYPQLDGYYPRPKALLSSDFMCQQHMQGYYFPFSMEANYNDVMHILNIPSTMCHELAHLRGYIYEDEANFIGYLACVGSGDEFFQYAGYLSVLVYLNNDIYYAWRDNHDIYEEAVRQIAPAAVKDQVWTDNIFVTQEEWDRINGTALLDTELVDKAADAFIDGNLKLNGISDGKVSYSRVVKLLLQYYRLKGLQGRA